MHEHIYYEHWNLGAHATADAISMAVPYFVREKWCACIERIRICLLCTYGAPFHVGVGGGDMQPMEHYFACNVFWKITYEMIETNYRMLQLLHSK